MSVIFFPETNYPIYLEKIIINLKLRDRRQNVIFKTVKVTMIKERVRNVTGDIMNYYNVLSCFGFRKIKRKLV